MNVPIATIGFHLTANPQDTAVCVINWGGGAAELVLLHLTDDVGTPVDYKFIKTAVCGMRGGLGDGTVVKTAIDAPFGWPEAFVRTLAAHHSLDEREEAMYPSPAGYGRRTTDHFVSDISGKAPPLLTSPRRGAAAMHCAMMLMEIADFCGADAADRTGTGLICEAWPDAALRLWTSGDRRALRDEDRYHGAAHAGRRRELAAVLQERCRMTDPMELMECCARHDQCLAAFVCALVARAAWLGKTHPPTGYASSSFVPGRSVESLEGWIHLPRGPVEALLTP
jgi:hypothetical protein